MNKLYEIEQIKQLKARYFRALDTNDWTLFGNCLSEDCTALYSDGELPLKGRDAIVDFMVKHMSGPAIISVHNGHTPEIEIVDSNRATGVWYLQDQVMNLKHAVQMSGTAIYSDEYQKEGESWLIVKTGYQRIYECVEPIGEGHKITKNMFAD